MKEFGMYFLIFNYVLATASLGKMRQIVVYLMSDLNLSHLSVFV